MRWREIGSRRHGDYLPSSHPHSHFWGIWSKDLYLSARSKAASAAENHLAQDHTHSLQGCEGEIISAWRWALWQYSPEFLVESAKALSGCHHDLNSPSAPSFLIQVLSPHKYIVNWCPSWGGPWITEWDIYPYLFLQTCRSDLSLSWSQVPWLEMYFRETNLTRMCGRLKEGSWNSDRGEFLL